MTAAFATGGVIGHVLDVLLTLLEHTGLKPLLVSGGALHALGLLVCRTLVSS